MARQASIGEKIEFGRYPQGTDGEIMPLRWLVLTVRDGRALLIADKMIECMAYHGQSADVTWETSSLRGWLNGTFFDSAFNEEEKAVILSVSLPNTDNAKYDTAGGRPTQDKVFALSLEELEQYFTFDIDRKVYASPYAVRKKAPGQQGKSASSWWLRSPGGSADHAANVHYIGGVNSYGNPVGDSDIAVRPALWLNLKS